jgi:membrane peptidoglycan carboxypeptidase
VSAKTGTADFFMDNLTVGWTPNLLTAVWVGNAQRSCLQPKDYTYMKNQIARGNIIEAGEVDNSYPFSPRDLAHYGLKPLHPGIPDCGHLDGVVSGYSGAAPIWNKYMSAALKGVPDTWYKQPADIVVGTGGGPGDDANFYLPGTQPGASSNCTYYGPVPLPTQTCTYAGPYQAPPPNPNPTPSPSPGPSPTPGPTVPPIL